ncbi:MAG TPA: choice-of-anchor tandem repeat GloVer-containing protein, partial [Rhizomicrobium sp.]
GVYGCGTVFKLAPDGTETVLHSFKTGSNGANPTAGLVADGAGNLYGTTSDGGAYGYGTVFEVTP